MSVKNSKVEKLLEENSDVWKSKASLMSYIRGGVRRSLWNRHPSKTKLIKEKRFQIPNSNPNGKKPTVWGGECEICNNLFIEKELQVDHIRDHGSSLKDISDIQQFIEDIVIVTRDDLRWVCKGCHEIVSYSQKMDISFEQARVEKQFIQIKKDKNVLDNLRLYELHSIPKLKKDQESLLRQLLLENMNSDKQTKD